MCVFSIVIPVYNRPQEVDDLLYSLTKQVYTNFEVILVEDGSSVSCEDIIRKYQNSLSIQYFSKSNSGPADSRNFGANRSSGKFLVFLDSDCILPKGYLASVNKNLEQDDVDAFGGPDRADDSFTSVQKAINYSMTSFFTTGGIRGGKKKLDRFYPRSFNLGMRKDVFFELGGFSNMRFGEDIDLSIRIYKQGYKCKLFSDSWVYHKRRTDFKKFFKQVYNSGIARISLYNKYPESLKLVHCLPSCFVLFMIVLLFSSVFFPILSLPILFFVFLIFSDATMANRSVRVGSLSVIASFVQLFGYGSGFIMAWWKLRVLGHDKFTAFENNFYE